MHPFKPNKSSQRGTAIVVALFVMALVAAAAVAMMSRLHVDIRRTESLLNSNQAYLYAQGSIAWAIDTLNNNLQQQKPNQLIDKIPIASKVDEQNGFRIQSIIYDAQARFNINNLTSDDYPNDFLRLLKTVDPKIDNATAMKITRAAHDWITNQPQGNEIDNFYAKSVPPYSAPHRLMAHASELILVQGMTPELYAKLKPYIIALPETTRININTADIPVIMSLSPTLVAESAKIITDYRQLTPFTDPAKLQAFDIIKNNAVPDARLTVTSTYFLVKTSVTVGEQQTILYTLLKRTLNKSESTITVLWQTKGIL